MKQKDLNILDSDITPLVKRLWTIRLLIIGGGIIVTTFFIGTFWRTFGLSSDVNVLLALSMMIAFGINLAGLIVGFVEKHKNLRKAMLGIIGNLMFILLFFSMVAYSFSLTYSDIL
ncbi:MAG: hypothetical protein HRT58_00100 [Crocinitomicaceae bacterium]|nr:hypothetical protein [Flavobacteriales bacterium]NQZ34021.1 hypothetical protein [Crocinitomicaceae bacterium]